MSDLIKFANSAVADVSAIDAQLDKALAKAPAVNSGQPYLKISQKKPMPSHSLSLGSPPPWNLKMEKSCLATWLAWKKSITIKSSKPQEKDLSSTYFPNAIWFQLSTGP